MSQRSAVCRLMWSRRPWAKVAQPARREKTRVPVDRRGKFDHRVRVALHDQRRHRAAQSSRVLLRKRLSACREPVSLRGHCDDSSGRLTKSRLQTKRRVRVSVVAVRWGPVGRANAVGDRHELAAAESWRVAAVPPDPVDELAAREPRVVSCDHHEPAARREQVLARHVACDPGQAPEAEFGPVGFGRGVRRQRWLQVSAKSRHRAGPATLRVQPLSGTSRAQRRLQKMIGIVGFSRFPRPSAWIRGTDSIARSCERSSSASCAG